MKRICWYIFIFAAMRHLKEIILRQRFFGNFLSVRWLQAQLVSSTINLVIGQRTSSLIEISLHLMASFIRMLLLTSSSLVWPIFKAIASSTPPELWVFKADCIELFFSSMLSYRWVMSSHVHSKIFYAGDGLLPVESLLRIVDLR